MRKRRGVVDDEPEPVITRIVKARGEGEDRQYLSIVNGGEKMVWMPHSAFIDEEDVTGRPYCYGSVRLTSLFSA